MTPYPIGDMLTRIRNASAKFHSEVAMPHSKIKEAIAGILKTEGYILDYEVVSQEPQAELRLTLKYRGERTRAIRAIHEIRLVSKPSRRVFVGKDNIPRPLGGMGICIVSTSQGVMAGHEARQLGIGGEVLLEVK